MMKLLIDNIIKSYFYLLRFITNLLSKLPNKESEIIKGVITAEELSKARFMWLISAQNKIFNSPKFD